MVYIDIIVLDLCCCMKNIDTLVSEISPCIHQRFRESKIDVVMLLLKGHKTNQTRLFQAVMQENQRKWRATGRWAQKQVRKLS